MLVHIVSTTQGASAGKLAEAELCFDDGPLSGLKLVGFAIWEGRNGRGGTSHSRPASTQPTGSAAIKCYSERPKRPQQPILSVTVFFEPTPNTKIAYRPCGPSNLDTTEDLPKLLTRSAQERWSLERRIEFEPFPVIL